MEKEKVELPKKLHELVRVAIEDVKKCNADPRYGLDMDVWHSSHTGLSSSSGPKICRVCMAGAVMAQTLGAPYGQWVCPDRWPPDIEEALCAIDRIRTGSLAEVFEWLGVSAPKDLGSFPHPEPTVGNAKGFKPFIKSWEKSQKWLEERNL